MAEAQAETIESENAVETVEQNSTLELDWFVGKIKSYAPQQGYGFIECRETFDKYSSDVFLHKNQVQEGKLMKVTRGDSVRFSVEIKKEGGRPQARNVTWYTGWVEPSRIFEGRVKTY